MGECSLTECHSIYRQSDTIEKAFSVPKTDLDTFPMMKKKECIFRGMQSTHLNEKDSMERMILELGRTMKQKDILDAPDKVSWW